MNKEELKKKFKLRDRVITALTINGHFRIAVIKNTKVAQVAQEKHELSHIPAYILAKTLASASMVASFLKGEERTIIEAEGNGPVSMVFAEALQIGEVRGFVRLDPERSDIAIEKIDDALGLGLFKVTSVLYNRSEPATGIVPIQKGDISTDLAYYMVHSEQIPSAVILDVDFDNHGKISESGGLMIQAMPGATREEIETIFEALKASRRLTSYFREGLTPDEVLKAILPVNFQVLKSSPVDFFCRCSKDGFMSKMVVLPPDEIIDMQKNGENELVCKYCNSKYYLEEADFKKILTETKARTN